MNITILNILLMQFAKLQQVFGTVFRPNFWNVLKLTMNRPFIIDGRNNYDKKRDVRPGLYL